MTSNQTEETNGLNENKYKEIMEFIEEYRTRVKTGTPEYDFLDKTSQIISLYNTYREASINAEQYYNAVKVLLSDC